MGHGRFLYGFGGDGGRRKCGAEVNFRPALRQRAVSQARSANDKVRTAAAIYPDATAIVSPAIALRASCIAALAHHLNAAARVGWTVISSAIVRRAGDGLATAWTSGTITGTARASGTIAAASDDKVRAAAAVYPDTTAIKSPGGTLDATRIAALAHHLDAAAGVDRTEVPSAIVRRASDGLCARRRCCHCHQGDDAQNNSQ
jgi:hypothetical protein